MHRIVDAIQGKMNRTGSLGSMVKCSPESLHRAARNPFGRPLPPMKCTHLLGQRFVKGVSSKGYIFADIMHQHAARADFINVLALHFEVVDPRRRGTGLDTNDGRDFVKPTADPFAHLQVARFDKLLAVLAPERMIGRAADLVVADCERQ
jgi:hypothetical protein